jgi:hypothetical protein
MAEVVEGYVYVVEMVGVGWVDAAFGPAWALASTLACKECQLYTITLRASSALC